MNTGHAIEVAVLRILRILLFISKKHSVERSRTPASIVFKYESVTIPSLCSCLLYSFSVHNADASNSTDDASVVIAPQPVNRGLKIYFVRYPVVVNSFETVLFGV